MFFLTTIFRACLLLYLSLSTASMRENTLIEHKEAVVVCEEGEHVNLSYNALLTTPKNNIIAKPIVPIVIIKSTLTYTNCDKIGHLVETYHNMKKRY